MVTVYLIWCSCTPVYVLGYLLLDRHLLADLLGLLLTLRNRVTISSISRPFAMEAMMARVT